MTIEAEVRLLPQCSTFLLGVNYWSRAGGPRMWEEGRYDRAQIATELAQMRAMGLNVCRSFCFVPTFMPTAGQVDADCCKRYGEFLRQCEAASLMTVPSFLVGHMSGENYDFVGQRGRSPYVDPELLGWQEQLIAAVASEAKVSPAVVAYLASNEMPLWGGAASGEAIVAWTERLRDALRRADPARPFGLGDGVMNLKGGNNGFHLPGLLPLVDFVGPHTYRPNSDALRQALNTEYCLRSVSYAGKPLLLEEFGASSTQASEANQALYYREAIHGALSAGAAGALGWCYSDFDLDQERPYSHHAFELGFGITRADGSEKPVCDELRAISKLVASIDFQSLVPPRPRAAIIVPSYFNHSYPFSWEDQERMQRVLLQSYALCVKAGFEAELLPEDQSYDAYQLLLLPATQKLLTSSWSRLLQAANAGATVYWSYFSGDYAFHQGAWCHRFEALTGTRHNLRYGCFDLPSDQLELEGAVRLDLDTLPGWPPYPRAYLPVEALGDTQILAGTTQGHIGLTRASRGKGAVYFAPFPIEFYLAEQANINEADHSEALYRLLADEAKLYGPTRSMNPLVQVRLLKDSRGPLLWLFNRSWSEQGLQIDSPAGQLLCGSGAPLVAGSKRITLGPKAVEVYRLVRD